MRLEQLFKLAMEQGASDIHLLANSLPIFRIDGLLQRLPKMPELNSEMIANLVLPALTEEQRNKFLKERELDFSYEVQGCCRLRVNLHWEKGSIGLVARIVPSTIPSMEDIGMPTIVYEMIRQDRGLILVTGPAGCGKSTSLAAMINLIHREQNRHIITLEDPIEFIFKQEKSVIRQRQLGMDMLSFQESLKHVLRQDPNVLMVGEMRDLETIAAAITLAETGHLVLATLHTYDAGQTIDRIVDIFPPYQQSQIRLQLSITLMGIISQRLLPKADGGRIACREVLIKNPAIAHLIRDNKINQIRSVMQTSAKDGMLTMDQDLKSLYKRGLITKIVAEAHMTDPSSLLEE
ncbi:MAG: type IV pilus twitching motility protein PilT [bacterium]